MPGLFANDLGQEEFLNLARDVTWPEESLICAFSLGRAVFDEFVFDKAFLASTDSGRIFSPSAELRWRAMNGVVRTVFLGDMAAPQGLEDFTFELENLVRELDECFLWGERTEKEPEWIEQQAPHRFKYPILDCQFPKGRILLVIEKWVDSAGLARFSRYHSIRETPGGSSYATR
jgi:hypothetical protein